MQLQQGQWINEPPAWSLERDVLQVTTGLNTDFWRETHYGFIRHSGHFFGCEVEGDFTFQLCIEAQFSALYDQAGLMIEQDPQHWCKAGIEYADDRCLMSSVLTHPQSDWATGVFHGDPARFWMRATVENGVLRLQYSEDGHLWPLLRLCPFPGGARRRVGAMCCTPQRAGLQVRFSECSLTAPLGKALHDLS
ncbi:DUF1349 domain-containing protein [Pantoea sp. 1.19]|uniref:DUF1349 domain-containing protein n=1 Tax=Pantoea sp. 1.19 TaxID=1925589 RepID=UPI0009491E25|nr:DUF1349 domain-containing protein [Pantoea sp. 1.19]